MQTNLGGGRERERLEMRCRLMMMMLSIIASVLPVPHTCDITRQMITYILQSEPSQQNIG